MIKSLLRIIFFSGCIFLLLPSYSYGQKLVSFTGDSTKFIGELNLLFENLAGKEDEMAKSLMQSFIQKWNSEKYDPAQKKMIYTVGNLMLKKKMRPFPDFYNYIRTIDILKEKQKPESTYYEWFGVLKKLGDSKNARNMTQFLDVSESFLTENDVYRSSSTIWRLTNPSCHFSYDTVPVMTFGKSDLICYSNRDSLYIFSTEGKYLPLTNQWFGNGGTVDWRRAGLDTKQVYASLSRYTIQMKFSKFSADSVEFYHKKYFDKPVYGQYTDKVLADMTEDRATYPRFSSYDKQIGIKELFKNIDYLGGFSMEGNRIIGTGDEKTNALLSFKRKDREFIRVTSKIFIIREDRINSNYATVAIYHESDSLYHPGIQVKYNDPQKELLLSRDERITSISPWYDSWHQIEIYCEALTWKINDPRIDISMIKGPNKESRALFESTNYYSQQRYEKIQGIDEMNPLYLIRRFCEQQKTRKFTLDEIAKYLQKPIDQVEATLLTLAYKGFMIYKTDTKTAVVKDKLFNYVDARNGKKDYDVIYFNSEVKSGSNGILGLDSFELRIQGVPRVFLSDSQQVVIVPSREEVILTKGGDFLFSGKVEAGLFDLYGKNLSFSYNSFKLNLPEVDSMGFFVHSRTKDPKTQQYPLVKVKTYLKDLTGDLIIDDPKNKSGLKNYPQYPIFNSKSEAKVNWDKKYIKNGVYRKENFYYTVLPFSFKSIADFPTDSLTFRGSLTSAGIFPDIAQPLLVRPDYSLGIETETGPGGLPVYGDKGRFTNRIEMSNEGLKGSGRLDFMHSTSFADNYIFYPDSMRTMAKTFNAKEVTAEVEFPSVAADSVNELWLPYGDYFGVSTISKEMQMYNNESHFAGSVVLSSTGMTGEGTIKIRDAEMDSRLFKFGRRTFDANIANFRIKSYDLAELTISTKNYQTHFDFDQRKGEFKSNVGISRVEFPVNKYICKMDRFDWLIDNEEIALYNDRNSKVAAADTMSLDKLIDVDFSGSEFISVHPQQDSLRFFAMSATYSLRQNIIKAQEVKFIKVADVAIYPDSGRLYILKDAVMLPLKRAGILTTNRYHHFYNADVSIASRKNYTARGYYDYVERGGNKQQIWFGSIKVDSAMTKATGTISDSSGFRLSPDFLYRGDVLIRADRKLLTFDGGFRPITDCFGMMDSWTAFNSEIDPENVIIPLSQPLRDLNNQKLNLGIYYSNSEGRIIPAFFDRRDSFSDSVMVSAPGKIDYIPANEEFRIMSDDKRNNPGSEGNLVSLKTSSCILHGEGKINLGMIPGAAGMESYGSIDYYVLNDSIRSISATAFRFPFSEDAMKKMVASLMSINLPGLIMSTSPYNTAIKTVLGSRDFEKYKPELELTGRFRKFPEELMRTMFLADLRMRWDTTSKSWISYGKIGIGNIGDNQINRYVDGTVEFTKKRNGDDFTIYLQLTENEWYFFNYRNNLLQILSSNLEFNDLITRDIQNKSEQKRLDDYAKGYRYTLGTERKKRDFLRKLQGESEE